MKTSILPRYVYNNIDYKTNSFPNSKPVLFLFLFSFHYNAFRFSSRTNENKQPTLHGVNINERHLFMSYTRSKKLIIINIIYYNIQKECFIIVYYVRKRSHSVCIIMIIWNLAGKGFIFFNMKFISNFNRELLGFSRVWFACKV